MIWLVPYNYKKERTIFTFVQLLESHHENGEVLMLVNYNVTKLSHLNHCEQ